jgi:hypothetical protein
MKAVERVSLLKQLVHLRYCQLEALQQSLIHMRLVTPVHTTYPAVLDTDAQHIDIQRVAKNNETNRLWLNNQRKLPSCSHPSYITCLLLR